MKNVINDIFLKKKNKEKENKMNWSKYEINLVYFSRLLAIHQEWVFEENGKMIGWRVEKIEESLTKWNWGKLKLNRKYSMRVKNCTNLNFSLPFWCNFSQVFD